MAATVRYRASGDNSVLRSVLYDVWHYRCYWCRRPKDYADVEIDHIIPRTVEAKRLQQLVTKFALPPDFEVHDPRNLAPICRQCNGSGGKGDEVVDIPAVHDKLRRAESLRSQVIRRVESFAAPGRTAAALIMVKEADVTEDKTRIAFAEHGPAVMQKLVLLGEAYNDYKSFRTVPVEVDDGSPLEVGTSFDSQARRAVAILEDVCGGTLEDVLAEPVAGVWDRIHARVQAAFEALEGPVGPTNSGPPVGLFVRIDIDSVGFVRVGTYLEFTFGGDFDASLSASLVQDDWDGLVDLQGEAYVTGDHSFVVALDLSDDNAGFDSGEPTFERWDSQIWTTP